MKAYNLPYFRVISEDLFVPFLIFNLMDVNDNDRNDDLCEQAHGDTFTALSYKTFPTIVSLFYLFE